MGAYTPVGDLVTISVCYVMLVLMFFSYNKDNRSFRIFLSIVVMLLAAAHTNIVVHILAGKPETVEAGFGMRCVFHALLYWVFALFSVYIGEVTRLERSVWRRFLIGSTILFLGLTILDIVFTVRGSMIFEAQTDTIRTTGYVNTFPAGYVAYVAFLLVMLYYVRNILYRKVMLGFYGTMAVSFIVNLIQGLLGETSFTVATFLFPVLGMFYIMHSNPYDAHLGAMDVRAFEDAIRRYYERKREFLFVSLYKLFRQTGFTFLTSYLLQIRHL